MKRLSRVVAQGALAVGLIFASASGAFAFELCNGAGEAIARATSRGFDFGVSVGGVTDSIDRGITQSNHAPTFSAQAEAAFGLGYAGVSMARLAEGAEFGWTLGVRPEFGRLALDIGVGRSVRSGDPSENETEFYAAGLWGLTDRFSAGAEFDIGSSGERCFQGILQFDLGKGFEASAELGRVSFNDSSLVDYFTWGAGLSYELSDWATLDLRYTATNLSKSSCAINADLWNSCDARVTLGITLATSLAHLAKGAAGADDDR